jgi:hypothetical protein
MILAANCYNRKCKHYRGVKNDGDELTERVFCKAYPDKIPDDIAYGKNKHLRIRSDQLNDIVFEKISD